MRKPILIRTDFRLDDIETIVRLHGILYSEECGFDSTFEAYVAEPLAEFVRAASVRQRLWIAHEEDRIVGCVAIVAADERTAQLRWFLVRPEARGVGLGTRLLRLAVDFAIEQRYDRIILRTVSRLTTAASLYRAAGFVKVEMNPCLLWSVEVVEEKYERTIGSQAEP